MIFSPDLLLKALQKLKTQTRRPARADETVLWDTTDEANPTAIKVSVNGKNSIRTRYEVGKTYAMVPGRGKPAAFYHPDHPCFGIDWWEDATAEDRIVGAKQGYIPARFKLLKIRAEDVRDISAEDAIAEGFEDRFGFWLKWTGFYDKPMFKILETLPESWIIWHDAMRTRKDSLYESWALNFEMVIG